jgi:hypothetical protein
MVFFPDNVPIGHDRIFRINISNFPYLRVSILPPPYCEVPTSIATSIVGLYKTISKPGNCGGNHTV